MKTQCSMKIINIIIITLVPSWCHCLKKLVVSGVKTLNVHRWNV